MNNNNSSVNLAVNSNPGTSSTDPSFDVWSSNQVHGGQAAIILTCVLAIMKSELASILNQSKLAQEEMTVQKDAANASCQAAIDSASDQASVTRNDAMGMLVGGSIGAATEAVSFGYKTIAMRQAPVQEQERLNAANKSINERIINRGNKTEETPLQVLTNRQDAEDGEFTNTLNKLETGEKSVQDMDAKEFDEMFKSAPTPQLNAIKKQIEEQLKTVSGTVTAARENVHDWGRKADAWSQISSQLAQGGFKFAEQSDQTKMGVDQGKQKIEDYMLQCAQGITSDMLSKMAGQLQQIAELLAAVRSVAQSASQGG